MLKLMDLTIPELQTHLIARFIDRIPDMSRLVHLTETDRAEVLAFLAVRPVHTVVMSSFIADNGIVSDLNRGEFFGFRSIKGDLEGVALIGHSTLVEGRTEDAIHAFAITARTSKTRMHLIMSSGDDAATFWDLMTNGMSEPRLVCTEELFEIAFPFAVKKTTRELKNADMSHLLQVAEAQAEVAMIESGVDPMLRDREGFLGRVARRIEQKRIFVVTDGDDVIFKADIIAETNGVIYLEGIYVDGMHRGKGIGSECLAALSLQLLDRAEHICLLSNVDHTAAHKSFAKAGYKNTDRCTTLFV